MDIYGLVAAHMRGGSHSAPIGTRAEDRYYASHCASPRLSLRALRPLALAACVMLILGVTLL